jgi:hypothetical protein
MYEGTILYLPTPLLILMADGPSIKIQIVINEILL